MYYVALPGEDLARASFRYKRSGIGVPSSSKNATIRAASFLLPPRTKYVVLSAVTGQMVASGYNTHSYWHDELRRDIPNWFDLNAYDRKTLNV